jgi:UDP-4-amino-4,6-dideoxy-N-acetyl-beta-L-altrosamine transaminase
MSHQYIPYGRQSINEDDIAAVVEVLRSDWLTQGPLISRFEQSVSEYCGAKYGVAVCNATSALHLVCRAMGLGPGDSLWTSPNTFVASANCALFCGASVDFVDIDPYTYNMSVEVLSAKLEQAEKAGHLPKIVVPVHFAGQSCEMKAIAELSVRYGFRVIEDACHAIGGQYTGMKIGTCLHSDAVVFSFHPVKVVTAGEGGMVLTNDRGLYEKISLLRSHGITRDPRAMSGIPHGGWYYEQIDLGYNYRMTEMQAALGMSQMRRLDAFVKRRQMLARHYHIAFKDLPLHLPWQHPDTDSAWHLYVVRLQLEELGMTRKEAFDALHSRGIGVQVHYIPVYLQPFYESLGFCSGHCPQAERYYAEALSLPLHPSITKDDEDRIIEEIRKLLLN